MKEVIHYSFFWRTEDNTGVFQLALADGTGGSLEPDSPQEAMLLLDVLRNEKPIYYEAEHQLLMTGLEPVGEGEKED
ncbi:MAG: hypothetical protein AAF702_40200 [Chloroflexota bacterium]